MRLPACVLNSRPSCFPIQCTNLTHRFAKRVCVMHYCIAESGSDQSVILTGLNMNKTQRDKKWNRNCYWKKIQTWNIHTAKIMSYQVFDRSYSANRKKPIVDYQGRERQKWGPVWLLYQNRNLHSTLSEVVSLVLSCLWIETESAVHKYGKK